MVVGVLTDCVQAGAGCGMRMVVFAFLAPLVGALEEKGVRYVGRWLGEW